MKLAVFSEDDTVFLLLHGNAKVNNYHKKYINCWLRWQLTEKYSIVICMPRCERVLIQFHICLKKDQENDRSEASR